MRQKRIVYSKKVEDENDVYRYYIIRKGENDYYIKAKIINFMEPVRGVKHVYYRGSLCLKITPEEIGKVIELLERGLDWFEGVYAQRDDWEEC
jgi:hypothetical protein